VITARTIKSGGGALGLAVYEPAQNRFNREIVRTIAEASGIKALDPNRITSQIAKEIGPDPAALRAQVESIMSNRPVDKAQRLTHRENAILQLHEWMESNHGADARTRISRRDENPRYATQPGTVASSWRKDR